MKGTEQEIRLVWDVRHLGAAAERLRGTCSGTCGGTRGRGDTAATEEAAAEATTEATEEAAAEATTEATAEAATGSIPEGTQVALITKHRGNPFFVKMEEGATAGS